MPHMSGIMPSVWNSCGTFGTQPCHAIRSRANLTKGGYFPCVVLDRSGSMATPMGTGGRSRHEEAVHQLMAFLEASGEETRFGVAVFNKTGVRWRSRLLRATPNKTKAETATHLRARWCRAVLEGRAPKPSLERYDLEGALDLDPR